MPANLNRIIKRALLNETRRATERRTGARPARAALAAGNSTVRVAGQVFPAANVSAASGSNIAVRNVGRPANALYMPDRASGVAYNIGVSSFGTDGSGGGGGSGAADLDALSDVTLTAPAQGHTLQYNASTRQWVNVVPPGGAGGAPSPHVLAVSGGHHTDTLPWSDLDKAGSNLLHLSVRQHSNLQGIGPDDHHAKQHVLATETGLGPDHTISGAETGQVLRASDAGHAKFEMLKHTDLDPASVTPNQHHFQQHLMVGPDHTASGLISGYTIRAFNATGFQWDQLQHDDLGGVTVDQHHPRQHDIITGDLIYGQVHTIVGTTFDIPGAVALNTLGLLRPSPAPGATAQILRTDGFGGLQLDTNLLYVDGANNRVGINRVPGGAPPNFGAAALDIQASATGDLTQRIKQIAGQTGRLWRIEDVAGNELIVLDSVGNLQSGYPGFVSALTGWQITPGGNAEFNNIWARGELHASVFVKDEIHATGGTFFVATAGTLHEDADIDSSTVDDDELWVKSTAVGSVPLNVLTTSATFVGNTLHVSGMRNELQINDPPSGPGTYFQPGEILRCKTEVTPVFPDTLRLADLWLEVVYATQDDGFSRYSVLKRSGSDTTIPKGTGIVSYGKRGDGRIMMTSDLRSDEGYTPYLDVFTTGNSPWDANDPTAIIPRLRLGQLKGVGVQGVSGISQYGMIASDNLANTNAGYIIASNLQLGLYRVPITVNDGTNKTGEWLPNGQLKLGKNVAQVATTSFEVDTKGDVWIGDRTNSINPAYLHWDQVAKTLYIRGDLVVGGGGGTGYVTVVDAQEWDSVVDSNAQGYAGDAYTNAQGYFNGLRILRVTGTWTPGANTLSWGALTLFLSNGTTRTVAARTGQAVSLLTYLYADLTGTGTISLVAVTTGIVVPSPNYMLIAVATPGNATLPVAERLVTVTVTAGNTWISGGSIVTGSIVADNIAANAVTANTIQAGAVHANHIDASVYQTAGSYRVMVVDGVFGTSTATPNLVSWTGIRLLKADSGAPVTIADGSTTVAPGQTYFYILPGDVSGCAMKGKLDVNFADIDPNAIMVAVATYATGAKSTTVVMAMGGVIISGDNVKAGTISATNIHADVYTAMGGRTVMAVTGSFNAHATTANAVTWTALTVRKRDGVQVGVNASAAAGQVITARTFFYIPYTATGTVTISSTITLTVVPADAIMIAVVDPGPASGKVSITMVNGGTYVSGDSIIARSILTENIKAGEINASIINSDVYIAAGGYRVAGVTDTFVIIPADPFRVTWTSTFVRKGDGTTIRINDSNTNLSGLAVGTINYLYIPGTATSPTNMLGVVDPTTLPAGAIVIAIVERGANAASYRIVAGGTLITGDNIMTGTIVAANIKAGAVTADKIFVNSNIDVKQFGSITGGGKAFGSITAGFFMGWDTAGIGPDAYKFQVGNVDNSITWDGANIYLSTNQSIQILNKNTGDMLSMSGPANASALLRLTAANVLSFSNNVLAPQVNARKLVVDFDTFQIVTPRTNITHNTSFGLTGEIAWEVEGLGGGESVWLYICYAPSKWVRMLFPLTIW